MTAPEAGTGRRANTLAWNTAWLAGARGASHVFSIALTVVLARGLGSVGFGQYSFVGAVIVIGAVITTFGTESFLVREIAGRRGDPAHLVAAALRLQLMLSAAFAVVVLAGAGWLPHRTPDTIAALRLYVLALFPLSFTTVYSAALRGWERMDLSAVLTVGTAALQAGAALIAVLARVRLPAVMLCLLGALIAAAVLGWLLCRTARPGFALAPRTAPADLGRMLRQVWPFAVIAGLTIVGQRIGVVLLALLAGDAPVGWFAAAARIVEGLKLTPYAYVGALLPVASRLGAAESMSAGRERLARLAGKSSAVLFTVGVILALGAAVLAGPLVALLYGTAYGAAVMPLRILAWALPIFAAGAPAAVALVSSGHERLVLRAGGAAVAATAGLGLWLIPGAGANGACVAVVGGELVRSALLLAARGRYGVRPVARAAVP
jgi:O-antigen/teichoic acid export membrane protein